jgi:hypothetical protein
MSFFIKMPFRVPYFIPLSNPNQLQLAVIPSSSAKRSGGAMVIPWRPVRLNNYPSITPEPPQSKGVLKEKPKKRAGGQTHEFLKSIRYGS